jgi:hypothetical protein
MVKNLNEGNVSKSSSSPTAYGAKPVSMAPSMGKKTANNVTSRRSVPQAAGKTAPFSKKK